LVIAHTVAAMTTEEEFLRRRAEKALDAAFGQFPTRGIQLAQLDSLGLQLLPSIAQLWGTQSTDPDAMFGLLHYELMLRHPEREPHPDLALFASSPRPDDDLGELWDICEMCWPDREAPAHDEARLLRTQAALRDWPDEYWPDLISTFVTMPQLLELTGWITGIATRTA
jgi:hypothetical protein